MTVETTLGEVNWTFCEEYVHLCVKCVRRAQLRSICKNFSLAWDEATQEEEDDG